MSEQVTTGNFLFVPGGSPAKRRSAVGRAVLHDGEVADRTKRRCADKLSKGLCRICGAPAAVTKKNADGSAARLSPLCPIHLSHDRERKHKQTGATRRYDGAKSYKVITAPEPTPDPDPEGLTSHPVDVPLPELPEDGSENKGAEPETSPS